jgi:hypothetical protein
VDGLILAASLVLLLGTLISAWPAVAFIGSVEIAMQQVRRARAPGAATIGPVVPEDMEQAVRAAYASVVAGAPLSQRAMAERFGLSRRRVSQVSTVNRSSQYVWGMSIACQRASPNWLNAAWLTSTPLRGLPPDAGPR